MAKNVHTVVVDFDGTAAKEAWPRRPREFEPGFVRAMNTLQAAGAHVVIFSCRLSPIDPKTGEYRDPAHVKAEFDYVRDLLDRHDLGWVDIWVREGKPGGAVYVDDKAERYEGSWGRTVNRVLSRLKSERPRFPVLPGNFEETDDGEAAAGIGA